MFSVMCKYEAGMQKINAAPKSSNISENVIKDCLSVSSN